MKTFFLILIMFAFISSHALCQTTVSAVSNVVTQVSEDRDKVTVTYDLARKAGVTQYNVAIRITLDGEVVTAQALSGDVGPNVTPGYGKRIVWDVLKDLSELYGSLQVEVTAKANVPDCVPIKTVPVYAGLTGALATGTALIVSGLSLESESQELYDVYKNNLDPNDPVYLEISREDTYQDANSKHKTATWLTIGGATVIVAGGAVMLTRLIQINKYNKDCAGKTSDAFRLNRIQPLVHTNQGMSGISAGVAINLN